MYWEHDSQEKLERKQAFKHPLKTTSFCAYKHGLFQLPSLILECYVTRVHQRACGTFSPPARKKVKNGFQSKGPSEMGSCTGCLGPCHCAWNAEEWCLGNGAASRRAHVTEPLLQRAELFWCDVGFCLCEGLNVNLYGAMTLWLLRLAFQTPVCAHVCVHPWERDTRVHMHIPTLATEEEAVSTQAHSIACKVN